MMGGRDYEKLLDVAGRVILEVEKTATEVDDVAMKKLETSYSVIKKLFGSKNVSMSKHKPFMSTGSVSVNMKDPCCKNPEMFIAAASLGDNFEIYPRVDGSVHIAIAFSGLMKQKRGGV